MSEIKDRIEYAIGSMAQDFKDGYCAREGLVEAILSRQELAIVDREAELPRLGNHKGHNLCILDAQQEMLRVGYVKEVKD